MSSKWLGDWQRLPWPCFSFLFTNLCEAGLPEYRIFRVGQLQPVQYSWHQVQQTHLMDTVLWQSFPCGGVSRVSAMVLVGVSAGFLQGVCRVFTPDRSSLRVWVFDKDRVFTWWVTVVPWERGWDGEETNSGWRTCNNSLQCEASQVYCTVCTT